MSSTTQTVEEQANTDVGTVRDELLVRMSMQQNVINYTFVLLGVIATVVGISVENFPSNGALLILLAGSTLCVFLQAVYLKQQLYMELIARYITQEVYLPILYKDKLVKRTYRRWDIFLAQSLYNKQISFISLILSALEAFFPVTVGSLCLVLYYVVVSIPNQTVSPTIFNMWWYANLALLIGITIVAGWLRRLIWARQKGLVTALRASQSESPLKRSFS